MDHGEGLPYALEPMYISEGKDYISEDGKEADGYVNSEEAVKTTSYPCGSYCKRICKH